jgi:hypothetical protein
VELESSVGWQANSTRDEGSKGDQVDLPFNVYEEEELQPSRLQRKNQPAEEMEEVIKEIRELMLKSTKEVVSRRRLNRGGPARAARKKQQHIRGAGGQLQRRVWDPR